MIRIVGLSATLPNYLEVGHLLSPFTCLFPWWGSFGSQVVDSPFRLTKQAERNRSELHKYDDFILQLADCVLNAGDACRLHNF